MKVTTDKKTRQTALEHAVVLYRLSRLALNLTLDNASRLMKFLDEKGVIESVKKNSVVAFDVIRRMGYKGLKYTLEKSYQGMVYLKPIVKAKSVEVGKASVIIAKKLANRTIDAMPGVISLAIQTSNSLRTQASRFMEFLRREIHIQAEKRRLERRQKNSKNQLKWE